MNRRLSSALSELRSRLRELYGERLVEMILFGSHARSRATGGSDVDVLVVLKGRVSPGEEIRRSSEVVSEISLANDVVLSCVFLDEQRFLHRNGPLLRNVRREGVRL